MTEEIQVVVDLVKFDPENEETFPSVCQDAEAVAFRFGFTGGETLVFTSEGSYLGELTKMLEPIDEVMARGGR